MVLGALGGPDAGATQGSILNRRFDDNKSPKLDQTDATMIGLIIALAHHLLKRVPREMCFSSPADLSELHEQRLVGSHVVIAPACDSPLAP